MSSSFAPIVGITSPEVFAAAIMFRAFGVQPSSPLPRDFMVPPPLPPLPSMAAVAPPPPSPQSPTRIQTASKKRHLLSRQRVDNAGEVSPVRRAHRWQRPTSLMHNSPAAKLTRLQQRIAQPQSEMLAVYTADGMLRLPWTTDTPPTLWKDEPDAQRLAPRRITPTLISAPPQTSTSPAVANEQGDSGVHSPPTPTTKTLANEEETSRDDMATDTPARAETSHDDTPLAMEVDGDDDGDDDETIDNHLTEMLAVALHRQPLTLPFYMFDHELRKIAPPEEKFAQWRRKVSQHMANVRRQVGAMLVGVKERGRGPANKGVCIMAILKVVGLDYDTCCPLVELVLELVDYACGIKKSQRGEVFDWLAYYRHACQTRVRAAEGFKISCKRLSVLKSDRSLC